MGADLKTIEDFGHRLHEIAGEIGNLVGSWNTKFPGGAGGGKLFVLAEYIDHGRYPALRDVTGYQAPFKRISAVDATTAIETAQKVLEICERMTNTPASAWGSI